MKTVISKYPIKIGPVLVPKGTLGEVANIDEMRESFPNITYKNNSTQIAIKFLGLNPCIVHVNQIMFQP